MWLPPPDLDRVPKAPPVALVRRVVNLRASNRYTTPARVVSLSGWLSVTRLCLSVSGQHGEDRRQGRRQPRAAHEAA
jgi:hypothetical protein